METLPKPRLRMPLRNQYDEARDQLEGEKAAINNDVRTQDWDSDGTPREKKVDAGPSKVQEHYKDDVDINVYAERLKRNGVNLDGSRLPAVVDPAYYGDFTDAVDFVSAYQRVQEAADRFHELPAAIRDRFNNSPLELFNFVHQEKNEEEAVRLGLLKKVEPATVPAPEPPKTP